jgi:hypothetical protein
VAERLGGGPTSRAIAQEVLALAGDGAPPAAAAALR